MYCYPGFLAAQLCCKLLLHISGFLGAVLRVHVDDRKMVCRGSRSSLHYDPYHNLLCLVQGKKTVKLMSPEVTHQLYPMSILGESPNHSHVNFAHPDFEQHPLYKQALASQQVFALQVTCYALMRSQTDYKLIAISPYAPPVLTTNVDPKTLVPCSQIRLAPETAAHRAVPSMGATNMLQPESFASFAHRQGMHCSSLKAGGTKWTANRPQLQSTFGGSPPSQRACGSSHTCSSTTCAGSWMGCLTLSAAMLWHLCSLTLPYKPFRQL